MRLTVAQEIAGNLTARGLTALIEGNVLMVELVGADTKVLLPVSTAGIPWQGCQMTKTHVIATYRGKDAEPPMEHYRDTVGAFLLPLDLDSHHLMVVRLVAVAALTAGRCVKYCCEKGMKVLAIVRSPNATRGLILNLTGCPTAAQEAREKRRRCERLDYEADRVLREATGNGC